VDLPQRACDTSVANFDAVTCNRLASSEGPRSGRSWIAADAGGNGTKIPPGVSPRSAGFSSRWVRKIQLAGWMSMNKLWPNHTARALHIRALHEGVPRASDVR
jgi:hypothetical protein